MVVLPYPTSRLCRIIAVTVMLSVACGAADKLVAYPAPPGAPHNDRFTVRARPAGGEWTDVATYEAHVAAGMLSFASFDAGFAKPVEVEIRVKGNALKNVRVRPASQAKSETRDGAVICSLSKPAKFSVEVDGDIANNLMIFANDIEKDPVKGPANGVHYFAPGIHDLGGDGCGTLEMKSGETAYIAGGAIVYGMISAKNAAKIKIRGRGILSGAKYHNLPDPAKYSHRILLDHVSDASIEGLTIVETTTWNVLLAACDKVNVSNLKIIAALLYSDGINPVDCQQVTIDNCFIRNKDDCFSIKLRHKDTTTPITGCRDITIQNCVLWADSGRSFLIGPESSGKGTREYRDITFRNIDILQQRNYAISWAYGAMAINIGDDATLKNLRIEDVRVEGLDPNTNLLNFHILQTDFNLSPGGRVEDIFITNVSLTGEAGIGNVFRGISDERSINHVRFKNLRINGKVIDSVEEARISLLYANDITFAP
jgi:hypothetical protein